VRAKSPRSRTELELPPAKVRVKVGGGIAGHNGLRSISSHIGNDYRRVRLGSVTPRQGTGASPRPVRLRQGDDAWVAALCEAVATMPGCSRPGMTRRSRNKVHLALQGKGFFEKEDSGEKRD